MNWISFPILSEFVAFVASCRRGRQDWKYCISFSSAQLNSRTAKLVKWRITYFYLVCCPMGYQEQTNVKSAARVVNHILNVKQYKWLWCTTIIKEIVLKILNKQHHILLFSDVITSWVQTFSRMSKKTENVFNTQMILRISKKFTAFALFLRYFSTYFSDFFLGWGIWRF